MGPPCCKSQKYAFAFAETFANIAPLHHTNAPAPKLMCTDIFTSCTILHDYRPYYFCYCILKGINFFVTSSCNDEWHISLLDLFVMAENNSPHAFFYIHWLLENIGLPFNSTHSHNKIDTHPSVRLYTNCDKAYMWWQGLSCANKTSGGTVDHCSSNGHWSDPPSSRDGGLGEG